MTTPAGAWLHSGWHAPFEQPLEEAHQATLFWSAWSGSGTVCLSRPLPSPQGCTSRPSSSATGCYGMLLY